VSTEDEISELFDGWRQAIRAKDIDGSLSHYAPSVLAFDLIEPLRYEGLDAVRRRPDDWFSSFEGRSNSRTAI
jgi:ketosteroid isomerase-like protein